MKDALFGPLHIMPAEIYLPVPGVDLTKWAVVACDQYTSQPDYWQQAEEFVGGEPSTLHMIYPEAYLSESQEKAERRIRAIHEAMRAYMGDGTLTRMGPAFVYVQRFCPEGIREGLVAAFDLEAYDYNDGSVSPIRATEKTILERIPPRLRIRENAPLELPHIMILIDDPIMSVIQPLRDYVKNKPVLYDMELMMQGGRLRGYSIDDATEWRRIADALSALQKRMAQNGILYAVGDGNHSLATAKANWEAVKSRLTGAQAQYHPARYALAELVNVHDEALLFEPIHRVLTHVDATQCLEELGEIAQQQGTLLTQTRTDTQGHSFHALYAGKRESLCIQNNAAPLCVAALDALLNEYLARHPRAVIDYVHGEDAIDALSRQKDALAFELPVLNKRELFPMVQQLGALPKKTFSMGEAQQKRYYMESRAIL